MTETTLTGAAHHGAAPRPGLAAITIRQPWARAVAVGRKTIENRSRLTSYRGPLAIHAGVATAREGCWDRRIVDGFGRDPELGQPRGAIIAVARLVDCHPAVVDRSSPSGWCCAPWGDPAPRGGRLFHYVLADAAPVPEPVFARGSVALPWTLPADVEAQVRAQIEVVA